MGLGTPCLISRVLLASRGDPGATHAEIWRGILRNLLASTRWLWQRGPGRGVSRRWNRPAGRVAGFWSDRSHDGIRHRAYLGMPSQSSRLDRALGWRTISS